jgi:hypothetical protein
MPKIIRVPAYHTLDLDEFRPRIEELVDGLNQHHITQLRYDDVQVKGDHRDDDRSIKLHFTFAVVGADALSGKDLADYALLLTRNLRKVLGDHDDLDVYVSFKSAKA